MPNTHQDLIKFLTDSEKYPRENAEMLGALMFLGEVINKIKPWEQRVRTKFDKFDAYMKKFNLNILTRPIADYLLAQLLDENSEFAKYTAGAINFLTKRENLRNCERK